MKRLLLLLLSALVLWGQASSLTLTCPANATVGVPFILAVALSGMAQAGTQFTLSLPSDVVNVSVSNGAQAAAAGKQPVCSQTGATVCTGSTVMTYGMNTNLIQPGALIQISVTATSPGQHTFGIGSPVGGDASGNVILTSVNPPCAVSVSLPISRCDLNGDGATNQADVVLISSWIMGAAVPAGQLCDKNGDTRCNVLDLLIVVQAATGGPCMAVQ